MENKSNRHKNSVFTRKECRKDHCNKTTKRSKDGETMEVEEGFFKDPARVWYEMVVGVLAEMGGASRAIK